MKPSSKASQYCSEVNKRAKRSERRQEGGGKKTEGEGDER